ncbi:MAG TPA: hypothetical protein VJL81_14515 [Solirubrobacterales bacterium]|nr:hypothetical protein [Solirubrobacterales bacterium]
MSNGFDPTLYVVALAAIPTLLGLLQNGTLPRQKARGNELLAITAIFIVATLGMIASLYALAAERNTDLLRYVALAGIAALGMWVLAPTGILLAKWK